MRTIKGKNFLILALTSLLFFLFSIAFLINYLIGKAILGVEDRLIAQLETENQVKLEYSSLGLASFDTLKLRDLVIRSSASNHQAILASAEEIAVKLRPLSLIFGDGDLVEALAGVELVKPEFHLYPDLSLLDKFESEGSGETNFRALDLRLGVKRGAVRIYASKAGGKLAQPSPVAVIDLPSAELELKQGKGRISIESLLTVLPEQGFASGKLEISGMLDLENDDLAALIVADEGRIAGLALPDLRFFLSREDGKLVLDSSGFGQTVSIDGQWDRESQGRLVVALASEKKSFSEFIDQAAKSFLGRMFFQQGLEYSPEGEFVVEKTHQGLEFSGNLAIRDGIGRDVFRLITYGNQDYLGVERLELARGGHLISVSGDWDWQNLPRLRARVRNFEYQGNSFDFDCHLEQLTPDQVGLYLSDLRINQIQLGELSLLATKDFEELLITGFGGSLEGRVSLDEERVLLKLALKNFMLGNLVKSLTGLGLAETWALSGPLMINQGEKGLFITGDLSLLDQSGPIDLSFDYDGQRLKLDHLRTPWFVLQGELRREYDGASGDLALYYNGINYPVSASLKEFGTQASLVLGIEGLLTSNFEFSEDGTRGRISTPGINLTPLGLAGLIGGEITLIKRGHDLISGGELFLNTFDSDLPDFALNFGGSDRDFNLTYLGVKGRDYALVGGGRLWFDDQDQAQLSLSLANQIFVEGRGIEGGFVFQARFEDFDPGPFTQGALTGRLQGGLELQKNLESYSSSWDLALTNGSFLDLPLELSSRASAVPTGVRFETLEARWGELEFKLLNGFLTLDQDDPDFLLNSGIQYQEGALTLSGNLLAQGGLKDEILLALSGLRINKARGIDISSVFKRQGERFLVRRAGPAGLVGWIEPGTGLFDLAYQDEERVGLGLAGSFGESLDLTARIENFPLRLLENFPKVVKSARGDLNAKFKITGTQAEPDFTGHLTITNAEAQISLLRTPLTKLSLEASVTQGVIRLKTLEATNGRGAFSLTGSLNLGQGELGDLDLRLKTDRQYGIDLNLDDPEIRSSGWVLADLFISGNANAPLVQGRIALRDNEFFYMEDSAIPSVENWIKRIRWSMEVAILDGVSYVNPLVTAMLQPGSSLYLRNSIIDRNFLIDGRVTASRGTFDYINHEFRIEQPTHIEFKRTTFGLDPWLSFRGRLKLKDEDYENIDIFLTFSGPLSAGINPVFSSEPDRSEDEIRVLLGIEQPETGSLDGRRKNDNIMLRSTELISLLGLKPFTKEIREWFGLDIFTIRTPIVRNILERESLDALDPKRQLSIFRDTRFSLGKYLTSFMFAEYTLILKDDIHNFGDILPTHQFGLELSFDFLNFGYLVKPTEKSGFDEYEHSVEFRFRQRF